MRITQTRVGKEKAPGRQMIRWPGSSLVTIAVVAAIVKIYVDAIKLREQFSWTEVIDSKPKAVIPEPTASVVSQ